MPKELEPLLQKIGKYVVIDVIGAGGMGIVYRARDTALNRTVAIKMLKRSDAGDSQGLQLEKFFSRELRATGSLQHKNIVTVYESGEQDGNPYFVMECLEGKPISQIIEERQAMSLTDKLEVLVQVCDGLQYAHDRKPQVIHRDIKPANIILLDDGTVKIVDFGIARLAGGETSILQTGQLVGSLSYMSPEQINSLPIDSRTDIFSAGVLLYELLTYVLPFKGADAGATFVKILREDPAPLTDYIDEVPADLQACVDRALAKKLQDRYQSAEEFGFDLLQIQEKIKHGMTADLMQRAEAAMHRGDLERVKSHLQEIIRLDRQHERANRLLAEVRRVIQQQQRDALTVQMRSQAQVALAGQQYEEALACVEQALQICPTDKQSISLRDEIQNAISLGKATRDALRRAESALYAGDFDEAKEAVESALRLEPSSAEARALVAIIDKELAERARRTLVQGLVDNARQGISERKFEDAIESLRKAEQLDPSDSNVRELLQWASRGQEQEHRRRGLTEITDQIDGALRAGDFSSAYTICEVGLSQYPGEAALLRLKSIAEKQRDVASRRKFVQDQGVAVRELVERGDFRAAIDMLEGGLKKYPGEPNLESLLALARNEAQLSAKNEEETNAIRLAESQTVKEQENASRHALQRARLLKRSLEEEAPIGELERASGELRSLLSNAGLNKESRELAEQVCEDVDLRRQTIDHAVKELRELQGLSSKSSDASAALRTNERLEALRASFPRERLVQQACDGVATVLDERRSERSDAVVHLTRAVEQAKQVPLEKSAELLRSANEASKSFSSDPQLGSLLQQIKHELDHRLERRQSRVREIEQLEASAGSAQSRAALTQYMEHARSIVSGDRGDAVTHMALDRMQTVVSERQQAISTLVHEIEQITDKAVSARTVESAERFMMQAEQMAANQPGILDVQDVLVRVTAQVRGRRIDFDLIHDELVTLKTSLSQPISILDLDHIRRRAAELAGRYSEEPAILSLCEQIEHEAESAHAAMLQSEVRRMREESQTWTGHAHGDTARVGVSVQRLQELIKSFPDSVELRSMLFTAQESLQRSVRAQEEAEGRETAIRKEITAIRRTLNAGQKREALRLLENAAFQYPESSEITSILLQCRADLVAAEQVAADQAAAEQAASEQAASKQNEREQAAAEESRRKIEVESKRQKGPTGKIEVGVQGREAGDQKGLRGKVAMIAAAGLVLALGGTFALVKMRHLGESAKTLVTIDSEPSGADVSVGGQKCITPVCNISLAPGAYQVEAHLPGYKSSSQELTIMSGEATAKVALNLMRADGKPEGKPSTDMPKTPAEANSGSDASAQVNHAHLIVQGAPPGDRVFMDEVELGKVGPRGSFEKDVTTGTHRLRLQEGTQSLLATSRKFETGATITMRNDDFKAPVPATSQEEATWKRIHKSQDTAELEGFLRQYSTTAYRPQVEAQIEAIRWAHASSSGTTQSYRDYIAQYSSPPGPHLQEAQEQLIKLNWQAVQNTNDPHQLEGFLAQNPKGPYHDLAERQLDDLNWKLAFKADDATTLNGYIKKYPAGRHVDEAKREIDRVTPKPDMGRKPADTQPPASGSASPSSNDNVEVQKLLAKYVAAYETESMAAMQEIWPRMSAKQASGLRVFFESFEGVKLDVSGIVGPVISGNQASVSFTQSLNATDKKSKTQMRVNPKITMKLTKANVNGAMVWQIDSMK